MSAALSFYRPYITIDITSNRGQDYRTHDHRREVPGRLDAYGTLLLGPTRNCRAAVLQAAPMLLGNGSHLVTSERPRELPWERLIQQQTHSRSDTRWSAPGP